MVLGCLTAQCPESHSRQTRPVGGARYRLLRAMGSDGRRDRGRGPGRGWQPYPTPLFVKTYLLRTSVVRMGARRLKDWAEPRGEGLPARGLGSRPGPRLAWSRESWDCRRGLSSASTLFASLRAPEDTLTSSGGSLGTPPGLARGRRSRDVLTLPDRPAAQIAGPLLPDARRALGSSCREVLRQAGGLPVAGVPNVSSGKQLRAGLGSPLESRSSLLAPVWRERQARSSRDSARSSLGVWGGLGTKSGVIAGGSAWLFSGTFGGSTGLVPGPGPPSENRDPGREDNAMSVLGGRAPNPRASGCGDSASEDGIAGAQGQGCVVGGARPGRKRGPQSVTTRPGSMVGGCPGVPEDACWGGGTGS